MLNKGQMSVRILADGTIRLESADMSGVAHKAADDFFREVARLAGGTITDTKLKAQHEHHHHTHGQEQGGA